MPWSQPREQHHQSAKTGFSSASSFKAALENQNLDHLASIAAARHRRRSYRHRLGHQHRHLLQRLLAPKHVTRSPDSVDLTF